MALLHPLMTSSTGAIVGSVISLFPYCLLLLAASDGWELGRGQLAGSAVMAVIFGVFLGLVITRSREEEEKGGGPGEGESRAKRRSEVVGWLERNICACCGYPTLDASSTVRRACRLCDWEAGPMRRATRLRTRGGTSAVTGPCTTWSIRRAGWRRPRRRRSRSSEN